MTAVIDVRCGVWAPGGATCPQRATHMLYVHQIDFCTAYAELDGNRSLMLCTPCLRRIGQRVALWFADLRATASAGESIACKTCSKEFIHLHDVFEVESL